MHEVKKAYEKLAVLDRTVKGIEKTYSASFGAGGVAVSIHCQTQSVELDGKDRNYIFNGIESVKKDQRLEAAKVLKSRVERLISALEMEKESAS